MKEQTVTLGNGRGRFVLLVVVAIFALALAACGGSGGQGGTGAEAESGEAAGGEAEAEAPAEEEAAQEEAPAEEEEAPAEEAEAPAEEAPASGVITADNARDVELLTEFQGAPLASYGLTVSPDGQQVAVFGADGLIRIFDVASGEQVSSLEGHSGPGYGLAYSPDGQWLVSGGEDYRLFVWEVAAEAQAYSLVTETNVRDIRFTPDGERFAFDGPGSSQVFLLNTDGNEAGRIDEHGRVLGSLDISPDGAWLASGNSRGNIVVSDLDTLETVTTLNDGTGILQSTQFSPDGKWLATGSGSGDMWMWDTSDWSLARTWKVAHRNGVLYIDWSNDGSVLISVGTDGRIVMWDPTNARELNSFQYGNGAAYKVAVAPDGSYFATLDGPVATVRIFGLP